VAISSLLLAPSVAWLSRRTLALVGGGVVVAGYLLSAGVDAFQALLGSRLVLGLGAGTILAAANAAIACSHDADALYARVSVVGGLAAAALLATLPSVLGSWGYRGGFLFLGALAALLLPLAGRLPDAPGGEVGRISLGAPHPERAIPLLLALLLESTSDTAVWSFSERIGLEAGLDAESVGLALGAATVAGLLGAGLALWLGQRWGRFLPIALGLGVASAARLAMVTKQVAAVYGATQIVLGMTFFFILPFLMGAAAGLDRSGRWSAAAAGSIAIGAAVGPGLAGWLADGWGYPALGWISLLFAGVSMIAVLPACSAITRD
jgi:predicted MFS family arabinose efflux permease